MSNRWQDFLKLWAWTRVASILPDGVRRQVLYDLATRAMRPDEEWGEIPFIRLYETLGD